MIDIRHKPFEIDIDFIEFLISEGKKFNIIFTKADKLKKNNLLTVPAGDNVIRLAPPLIINKKHVDEAMHILNKTFKGL